MPRQTGHHADFHQHFYYVSSLSLYIFVYALKNRTSKAQIDSTSNLAEEFVIMPGLTGHAPCLESLDMS